MKKQILALFSVSVLAACSSKAPQPEPKSSSARDLWDAADEISPAPAKKESPKAPIADTSERSKDPWADLSSAIKSQNDESIRQSAEAILARVPGDERALNALAMVHYRKGRFDLAAYLLGKALQKTEKSELHSNMGLVELARNERASAIHEFRRAVEMNADDGVAAANLGAIYVAEHDYTKAVIVLEASLRKGPRDAKTLNNYAIALTATGNPEKALPIYEEALKENGNNRDVLLNQAILMVDHLNRPKEGLDLINRLKFLGVSPESRERLSLLENKAKAGVK